MLYYQVHLKITEHGKYPAFKYTGGINAHRADSWIVEDNENGALPAPTIANVDSDPDYELVINTIHSGFIAYDLPGSASEEFNGKADATAVKSYMMIELCLP